VDGKSGEDGIADIEMAAAATAKHIHFLNE